MTNTILQMMLVIGFVAWSVCFAQAQSSDHYKTEIPFDFTVGSKHYAAGKYLIEVGGAGQKFFVLRDAGGRNGYFIQARPGDSISSGGALLDFQRTGDRYVLSAIKMSRLISNLPAAEGKANVARNGTGRKVTIALSGGR